MTPQLFYLLAGNNTLTRVPDMPDLGDSNFNEQLTEDLNLALLGTLQEEDRKSIEDGKKIDPEHFDADKFNEAYSRVMEKSLRNSIFSYLGSFAVSDGTFYMESSQKLFKWKHGTAEWYDTGLIDEGESTYSFNEFNDLTSIGFKMAVSDGTVYVGKRSGHLFQSFDEGDTWNDVTTDLPFSVSDFNVIAFAGSTVYIATDKGVVYSNDGARWHTAFDVEGTPVVIEKFAVDGTTVYGATEQQVYQLKENSNTWQQVTPEVPSPITSITISDRTLYVGTLGRGVLRFTLDEI